MPRRKTDVTQPTRRVTGGLAERLADELRHARESGQPVIHEQEYPTGNLRVVVLWDEWDRRPLEERTAAILRAYELAEGREYRTRIALASGLTFPEAYAAGMLPYQVIPAVRKTDPVTREECHQAMLAEGGSALFAPGTVQLRFPTEEEANEGVRRLVARLPASEPVWLVTRDALPPDYSEDWPNGAER